MSILKSYDIQLRFVPPNRHHKNILEPRHSPIRSIFILLCNLEHDTSPQILEIRAVRMSKDLCGCNVLTAFEAAKGFTRPINSSNFVEPIDDSLREAHAHLVARRKFTPILRSHSLQAKPKKGSMAFPKPSH